jgi:hypothetical protein
LREQARLDKVRDDETKRYKEMLEFEELDKSRRKAEQERQR